MSKIVKWKVSDKMLRELREIAKIEKLSISLTIKKLLNSKFNTPKLIRN